MNRNKKYREWQCTYKRNIGARSRNHCGHGKAIYIMYSGCLFVALDVHHAMRGTGLCFYPWPLWPYNNFSTLSHKRHDL